MKILKAKYMKKDSNGSLQEQVSLLESKVKMKNRLKKIQKDKTLYSLFKRMINLYELTHDDDKNYKKLCKRIDQLKQKKKKLEEIHKISESKIEYENNINRKLVEQLNRQKQLIKELIEYQKKQNKKYLEEISEENYFV